MHNRKDYLSVLWQYVQWFLCPLYIFDDKNIFCFSDFSYTPGLVLLQLLLTNLQNILKIDVLAMKTEDH